MGISEYRIRAARTADIQALEALIALSTRQLSAEYTSAQIEATLDYIYGVDTELLADESYFLIESQMDGQHVIAACGGWSRRKTLFGGDRFAARESGYLDPMQDAAKIRAFFIHPQFARRGLGTQLLTHAESAIRQYGFRAAEMMATLPGIPLYRHHGYAPVEPFDYHAPNGVIVPFIRMAKTF